MAYQNCTILKASAEYIHLGVGEGNIVCNPVKSWLSGLPFLCAFRMLPEKDGVSGQYISFKLFFQSFSLWDGSDMEIEQERGKYYFRKWSQIVFLKAKNPESLEFSLPWTVLKSNIIVDWTINSSLWSFFFDTIAESILVIPGKYKSALRSYRQMQITFPRVPQGIFWNRIQSVTQS